MLDKARDKVQQEKQVVYRMDEKGWYQFEHKSDS